MVNHSGPCSYDLRHGIPVIAPESCSPRYSCQCFWAGAIPLAVSPLPPFKFVLFFEWLSGSVNRLAFRLSNWVFFFIYCTCVIAHPGLCYRLAADLPMWPDDPVTPLEAQGLWQNANVPGAQPPQSQGVCLDIFTNYSFDSFCDLPIPRSRQLRPLPASPKILRGRNQKQ